MSGSDLARVGLVRDHGLGPGSAGRCADGEDLGEVFAVFEAGRQARLGSQRFRREFDESSANLIAEGPEVDESRDEDRRVSDDEHGLGQLVVSRSRRTIAAKSLGFRPGE